MAFMSVWVPFFVCLDNNWRLACLVAVAVGAGCLLRWICTGLSLEGDELVVRNFFRTESLKRNDLASAHFQERLLSRLHRMELCTSTGRCVRVSGVSLWLEGPRLPWQRPDRRLEEVARFFEAGGLGSAYHAPGPG